MLVDLHEAAFTDEGDVRNDSESITAGREGSGEVEEVVARLGDNAKPVRFGVVVEVGDDVRQV